MNKRIDETILVNKSLPKSWTCPHCGKRNSMGKYKEEEFIEFFKTMQHCEKCGYVHIWFLKLTEDFKKKVVDYLWKMAYKKEWMGLREARSGRKSRQEVDGHDEDI